MMEQLTVTITDDRWPKLTLVTRRESANGPVVTQTNFQYDGAYSQFENELHNQLRPMVDNLIKRRKR